MPDRPQRIPADLSSMLVQIAWYERTSIGQIIRDVAGEAIKRRYDSIPPGLRVTTKTLVTTKSRVKKSKAR